MYCLTDYPKLEQWYQKKRTSADLSPSTYDFVQRFCAGIAGNGAWDPILEPLTKHLQKMSQPHEAFEEIYHFLMDHELVLDEMVSEIVERSLQNRDRPVGIYELAEIADHAPFVFLAGWYAFNSDQFERCLVILDRISPPTSASLTLQGQALLESGQPVQAIRILEAATRRDANEILTFFQLAKAYHTLDNWDAAWQALMRCQSLAPQSDEVMIFMSIVALASSPAQKDRIRICCEGMKKYLATREDNPDYASLMLDLVLSLDSEEDLLWVAQHLNLKSVFKVPRMAKLLPQILRNLQHKNWHQGTTHFLSKIIDGETSL